MSSHAIHLGTDLQAEVDTFRTQRAVIEQAKGVLMQILAIDEERAFAILARYSQDQNVKVIELARRLTKAATDDVTPSKCARGDLLNLLERLSTDAVP